MHLTDAQIHQFREHGFLAVPQFFSAQEIAAMRADLERLKKQVAAQCRHRG